MSGPSAPSVVIRFPLEAVPSIYLDCLHDGEERRLLDWLAAHPQYAELVDRAAELREEGLAA